MSTGSPTNPKAPDHAGRVNGDVLRAEGLSVSFTGQRILDSVDLVLRQGDVALLRGENGSGKTTLLNVLTGNLRPDAGTIQYLVNTTPRTWVFPPSWKRNLNPLNQFTPEFVAQEGFARTWQNVRLFGSHTLRDNISVANPQNPAEKPFVALIARAAVQQHEAQVSANSDKMLADLGLAGRENSSADRISLGQTKRVAIARAVATGARVLFLDEPLSGLDHQGIADVLKMLRELVTRCHLTLVIVEHVFNFEHLNGLVNVHWHLSDGQLRRSDATEMGESSGQHLGSSSRARHWHDLLANGAQVLPPEKLPRGAILTRYRLNGRFAPRPTLKVENFFATRGLRTVIGGEADGDDRGFALMLQEGEIAILQAPNGWGKSTLLEGLAGLIPGVRGQVLLGDVDLSKQPDWRRAKRGLRLNAAALPFFGELSVAEVMSLANNALDVSDGLAPTRKLETLSGGQIRKVALDAFLRRPGGIVALLDEPMIALDDKTIAAFSTRFMASQFASMLIAEPLRT